MPKRQRDQAGACGCVRRGMTGGAPVDEEGDQPAQIALDCNHPPGKLSPVGALPGTGSRGTVDDFLSVEPGDRGFEIFARRGPADQPWRRELLQAGDHLVVDSGLRRIRSDDLQIVPAAERYEGVPRAAAGMTTARGGANPGLLLEPLHPGLQIRYAEKDVIDRLDRRSR